MSNILEFFAPDMSMDFEELDSDQNGSDEILSTNSGQQDLPMILLNVPNDENSICRDFEYGSIESKVILNKMSIEHLLQNDDVKEEKFFNYANYFSEIFVNDNVKEDFTEKEITDDVEISPLNPNLLNENASRSNDIVPTYIDDAVSLNNSLQQKDFKAMEGESTHFTFSDANEREIESLNRVTSIHVRLSDNDVIERASALESINPVIIKKSGSDEQMTRETASESSVHLPSFDDKNMSNEDSEDLQTSALLLLADLAVADIDASPILEIKEIPNMSQSETNAQEVATNMPIDDNQTEISQHQGVSNLQFLPKQSTKDFEREQDEQDIINLIVNDSRQINDDSGDIGVYTNVIVDTNKETIKDFELDENNEPMNGNLDHSCSKFDDIILEKSYTNLLTKTQPDSTEKETLLSSPDISVGDRNSDNEIQSLEQFDIEDKENRLVTDDILPLCEQIKSDAKIEDSSNNYEQNMNQLSIGEQIIEDTENVSTSEESQLNESITEPINIPPTPPDGEQQLTSSIVTRSMIASLNLKDSTSMMSLDEKKQLLLEVRKKKSMLRSSILQNKQAQNIGEDNKNPSKNSLKMNSSDFAKSSPPQKKAPNKSNNSSLNRLTKQNTDKNKEYRCEFNVVVVRKNVPKPLSPASKLHEKMRSGGGITSALRSHNNKGKDNTGSYIPVLKPRGGRQNLANHEKNGKSSSRGGVHWDESRLTQESSPLIRSSPKTARQRPIPKSCLKTTSPPIDSLGNVLNANSSLTPMVKRGIKVTVKQVKYKGEE